MTMKYSKRGLFAVIVLLGVLLASGCNRDDADTAKRNMNKAADNFEIMRRVVFYNSIRDKVVLVTEGRCSVDAGSLRTSVICKVSPDRYIRNFYGKSDNTVYFVEQMESVPVNVYHYRRTFKPQSILPDIDFRGDAGAAVDAITPDISD
jgi:hypothetical protein